MKTIERRSPALVLPCLGLVGALVVGAGAAWAAPVRQPVVETPESAARALLDDTLAPVLDARGAHASITVSPPDARRAAPPCDRFIAVLPPGARLTGRTLVGVRCADGANWQAFVPAEVRIEAPGWTAARALRAGETIAAGDLAPGSATMTQTDFDAAAGAARGNAGAARGLATLDGRSPPPIGRVVLRPVAAGRALAAGDVRDEGRVNAGETVRVLYSGDGFSVTSEGRTVGPADPGATVQIRLASGTVVNGTLRSDHLVELPH